LAEGGKRERDATLATLFGEARISRLKYIGALDRPQGITLFSDGLPEEVAALREG